MRAMRLRDTTCWLEEAGQARKNDRQMRYVFSYLAHGLEAGAQLGREGPLADPRLHTDVSPWKAYVDGNQTISNDCRYAPVYQIQNGSLSIFVSNVQYYYTTNTGVDVQVFTPSLTRGNVTQSFRLASSGEVIWRNTLFDGGQAMFCSTDNGTIFAVFRTAARPEGCFLTRLMLFMASSCARLPEYVSTVVQTQVTTALRVIVTTEPRSITMTEREVSTYETTFLQTVTSTYETILPASTVTATYETTLPASTATATSVIVATTTRVETSVQRASTVTTTFQTVQPASTFVTTAVITQSASTITTTYRTTQPAVTVTQSVTATTTAAAASLAAPSLCGNQGMEYAVFANNPTYQNTGSTNYNPEFMKARSAGGTWTTRFYNSTYDTISGAGNYCPAGENAVGQIYGVQTTFNCREFSIDHRFYMFAYMSGTWRIEVTSIDDQVLTWVGAKAQTGWTKANADTNRYYGQTTSWLWMNVTAGAYYPVRVTFGNYGGGAGYNMIISDPTNNVAFTTDTRNSPYILRRSCDGTTAPPFPYLFGEEL